MATAIATEYQAIANYNNALATFEFAKGTIQQYNNVTIGEGPLPPWAQKKAADHFKERAAGLKTMERSNSQLTPTVPQQLGPAVGTGFTSELPPFAEQKWEQIPKSPDQLNPPPMQPPAPAAAGGHSRGDGDGVATGATAADRADRAASASGWHAASGHSRATVAATVAAAGDRCDVANDSRDETELAERGG